MKTLADLTLEELWELFPIYLEPHKEEWKCWYQEKEEQLKTVLSEKDILRIEHIGSTAIEGIWAKPIIDILVELQDPSAMQTAGTALQNQGYIKMFEDEKRIDFNSGYTIHGFEKKVYHVHLRSAYDHDELYFRDYLKEHPRISKEYEKLKIELWKRYEHDRDAYTEAKTAFVERYTKKAKKEYAGRYEGIDRRGEMEHCRMLDKEQRPDEQDILAFMGQYHFTLLQTFLHTLEKRYSLQKELRFPFGSHYGWGYKISHKKTHLCYLFFEKQAFTMMLQLPDSCVDKLEREALTLSEPSRQLWNQRYPCGERGGWIQYPIVHEQDFHDALFFLGHKKSFK